MKAKFNKLFTLLIILTLGIGQMWADPTGVGAGTYELSSSYKPGSNKRFKSIGTGIYLHRVNNSSWSDTYGMKLKDNQNGVAFYISSAMNVTFRYYKNSNSKAETTTFSVYSISSSDYALFTGGTENSTNVELSLGAATATKTIELEKTYKDYKVTDAISLSAGYYYIVGKDDTSNGTTYWTSLTLASSCAAGDPGNISKGTLSAGVLTLNAAGSPESGDTWYWQTAEDGEDDTYSGTSFNVSAAGTYYIRSYNAAGDCWSDAKSITITSTDLVENYTVVYKDGSTTLNSEVVAVGDHPAGIADPTKDCYSFAGWLNGSTPVADVTALSGAANEEIELTATWTPVYSSSATLISDENVSAKANVNTIFAASNIVSSITFTSGNYEFTSNETKKGYYGYKDKQSGDYMKIMLQQGKRVQVLFGNLGADPTITVNGAAQSLDASRATGDNAENTFTYTATAADALIVITMGSGTNTLKKVDILQLYTATYIDDENGNSSENNVAQVTLGTPTGSKTFMGWKADQAVTVDDEVVAANTTIAGGKTAVLSANTTFTAQWSDAAFTVTYYDGATELGSENVVSGGNPVNYADYQTKAMATFDGWYSDSELNTPIADISALTITANTPVYGKWTSTDARLSAIEFSSNAGTLSPAFNPEVVNYTYTMPYKTADIPTITGATSVNANAQAPIISGAATAWGETQTITGKAQSGDTKIYTITMQVAPKDGVSIIKATINSSTKNSIGEVTGLYKKDASCGGLSGYKFNGKGAYIGLELVAGQTFNEGDIINIHTTTAAGQGTIALFDGHGNTVSSFYDYGVMGGAGDNKFALPASAEEKSIIYVCRTEANTWNGFVDFIEVTRPMNPILTAITINGEAGVIDESLKTVTVELQPGYDLAALTIVPTIVSNTDEALVVKTVESNGGAWVLGPNTYRLTDKDGDYTEYTITLTAGALKHNVTFNTHGGSAVAGVEVVDGEYLTAGQVPANPTKEDYIFQYWSETEDGSEVDITTVQINADKEFHAIWASDGAIKLLDGSTVNHTNFITGVTADETVEFKGNTVNYAKFSGAVSGVNGVKDLTRVIAYNATTNKTKIQISAHNNSTSGRNILVKGLVEGADAADDLATIALGNKEDKVSEWIEFDNAANRTIYIMVSSSAGDVYFTQVKVIESGETPMKHAGEAGYSLNLNKGRFFGLASTDLAFEGLNARLSGDYTALNSGYAKLTSTSMSFTVASPVLLTVTTNNNKTYYVTEGAAGTDNETAKTGASEFNLTAGTWFITGGTSEVQITNIAFSAPKCEQPDVTDMVDVDLCEGDAFTALAVTANVSDGGTLHYQWYKHPAVGDDEAVGIDAATYTPDADGQYYVVVTNQLSGFGDNSKTSNTITVEHFAAAVITAAPENQRDNVGETVTLSVTASGKNLSYEWFTCDDESGTNPVAIVPAETNASLSVTVAAGTQWYKVVVSSDCGNAEAVAKVSEFTAATPQDVTATTTWDWTTDAWPASGTIEFANQTDEQLLADVDAAVPNNAAFHSDMLYGIGQYVWRSGNKFFQGKQIRFNNTVAGRVRVHFRSTGSGKNVQVTINGTVAGSGDAWQWTNYEYVPAGGVTIVCAGMTGNETGLTRIDKIEFQTPDYTRTAMLGNGVLGTLCVDHNVPVEGIQGATFYELAGKNAEGKIAFDQITTELEAGVPYVFQANGDKLVLYYGNTKVDDPVNGNGMYGTFTDITLPDDVPAVENLNDIYYFAQKALWSCTDLTSLSIPANRAYVKLSEIPAASASPAPGRIRMTLNVNGAPQVVTGVENLENNEAPVKMLINGQLFIMRGEKLYDATGRLVK